MRIVADENIPFVKEAFADLGAVETMSGRAIAPQSLGGAECLLVRSVTRVDGALLQGSSVRFVGTATAGIDHVDLPWLQSQGIAFAYAPGSNARSVAEYVAAALLRYAGESGVVLEGKTLGIIGVGQVGSRVRAMAAALGMKPVLNDPPLAEQSGDARWRPLGEALACDFVTLHTPLTREGPHATFHLAGGAFFAKMKPGAVLINTARGAVCDSAALKAALEGARISAAVLDVWENEPNPDCALIQRAFIATPHVAGYSFDGKVRGTEMIHDAACRFFGVAPRWGKDRSVPPPDPDAALSAAPEGEGGQTPEKVLWRVVRQAYDVAADDARFREILRRPSVERAAFFTRLRKEYPVRREFPHFAVRGRDLPAQSRAALAALGFRVL